MLKSFLIKRARKVNTGYFPWNEETLVPGCCLEYEKEDENTESIDVEGPSFTRHHQTSLSEIRVLTPYDQTALSPPRLVISSRRDFYEEEEEEEEECSVSGHDHDIIIPSPLGHDFNQTDNRMKPNYKTPPCYLKPHVHHPESHAERFERPAHLTPYHISYKNILKKHQCEYCLKWFDRPSSLSNHRLIHSNAKTFKCSQCSMCFLRKSDLAKHTVTHSGHKPHQCNVCGKRFSQSSNMLTHQRRHTGIRPYSCEVCGKSFYRKVDVRRHMSVHNRQ